MTKQTIKLIITAVLFGIAGVVIYLYFGESLLIKLNIQKPINYPLANVDILSKIKQDQSTTVTSGQTQINDQNLNFSTIKPLPTEANIYSYENTDLAKPEKQKSIAESFGLSYDSKNVYSDQIIGRYTSIITPNSSLRIYEDLGMVSYSIDTFTNKKTFTNLVDKEAYKTVGENFIRSKNINLDNYVYDKTKFYSADGYDAKEVSSPMRAHIIEFSYRAKISENPIIDNNTDAYGNPLRIWLDTDKNVIRMEYNDIGNIKEIVGAYKLKNKQQISNDIHSGKIKLINSMTPIGEDIISSSLYGISLGYYAINGYLMPVYVFEATSKTSSNEKGPSYFIMEAVAK